MITVFIAQHILDVHFGNNWTEVNIRHTLSDIGFEEAITVTAASPNSIAALLHHITYYTKIIDLRISGERPEIDEWNGFNHPPVTDAESWNRLKQDNLEAAEALAQKVREIKDEQLTLPVFEGYATYYKALQGLVEHAHYHLGQIVLVKNLLRSGK
jgi:uncharacterized damage-inducible protein DinB